MSGDTPKDVRATAGAAGVPKARISLNQLTVEDLASLKDELLRSIVSRASDPVAEAYGRHGNVHSSNSNAELLASVRTRTE
jgi:hypothetical protein